jgi:hypothetical protein
MYVYVFKGTNRLLGFTTNSSGENLPTGRGPWVLTNRLDMSREDDPRPIVQTVECLDDIEMHGYHITDGYRRVTDLLEP